MQLVVSFYPASLPGQCVRALHAPILLLQGGSNGACKPLEPSAADAAVAALHAVATPHAACVILPSV